MRSVSLIIGRGFTLVKMAAGKFARDFERVPEIEEVAPKDFVAIKRARDQQGRDRSFNSNVFLYKNLPWHPQYIQHRAIRLEMVKILRQRLLECVQREEVNHKQMCRKEVEAYTKALQRSRTEGMSW